MSESEGGVEEALLRKKLGNEAYEAKDYPRAIQLYTEAIELDPENHVYYSNRSVAYGMNKEWEKAKEDAEVCIGKDKTFIKGYFRLCNALLELKDLDGAIATLQNGLSVDPHHSDLKRKLRELNAKKTADKVSKRGSTSSRPTMDLRGNEEVQELNDVYQSTAKEIAETNAKIGGAKIDKRKTTITMDEISQLSDDTRLYRSLGKAFYFGSKKSTIASLERDLESFTKKEEELTLKKGYMEKKLKADETNLKEAIARAAESQRSY